MDHFEVDDCLRSMVVLVDTREQDTNGRGSGTAASPVSMSGRPYLMGTMLIILSCRTGAGLWNIPGMRCRRRSL